MRRYLAELGFKGDGPIPPIPDDVRVEATRRYIEAYETITGEAFVPDLEEPRAAHAQKLGALMKVTVFVRLKGEVLDPQGDAVKRALGTLGLRGRQSVRVGKLVEIELDDSSPGADFEARLKKMADEMLANPVIEDYEIRLS